ncbi:DUF1697 domain-containing protein [Luteococcus peritonei]|uniref:DUF1697 domain-containing protein n=1 Tax=Luteococcus peritonei TaxID=88874 RepID=A0ABW4RVH9_9ACTN
MPTHVVLLRGINVGGRHKLPMAQLRADLEQAGLHVVASYIQSGNLVLDTELDEVGVAELVRRAAEARTDFPVPALAIEATSFRQLLADNPFTPAEPKLEHVVVLPAPLDEQRRVRLTELAAGDDSPSELVLGDRVVYLHHPQGLMASRLAGRAMALLEDGTARNLATMVALERMLDGLPPRG